MGQKTHPFGFRLGFNKSWLSLWYGKGQHYIDQFHVDIQIRKMVKSKYKHAGIASIEVKRIADTIRVQINTARPGILIGKGGSGVQELKKFISAITKKTLDKILVDVIEIRNPELVAQLIAEGVAFQIQRRISYRRAMRKVVDSTLRAGATGVKIRLSGRLGGAEIARAEWYLVGKAAPADLAGRHRLRIHRSLHRLRPDRHQGLGLHRRQGKGTLPQAGN